MRTTDFAPWWIRAFAWSLLLVAFTYLDDGKSVSASPGAGDITTVAGDGSTGFSGDGGPATSASFTSPRGVAVDSKGNIFIADRDNHRVRRVDGATGVITTVAGDGNAAFAGDGGLATTASLNVARSVALDRQDNILIADAQNSRIRRVDGATGVITTVAGNGSFGFSGDGGPATSAALNSPRGLDLDSQGNIFIADRANNRVRKVDASTGVISTVAGDGTPAFSGDGGQATSASLNSFRGVGLDSQGNLFIADTENHRIRRVDAATGVITTVAGDGNPAYSGDGGQATSASLNSPRGVVVDIAGNLFIADRDNNRIRKVDASTGVITTAAGDGTSGFSGDGGPATSASLSVPIHVALDAQGNLFIADTGNQRIRKVESVGVPVPVPAAGPWGLALAAGTMAFLVMLLSHRRSLQSKIGPRP